VCDILSVGARAANGVERNRVENRLQLYRLQIVAVIIEFVLVQKQQIPIGQPFCDPAGLDQEWLQCFFLPLVSVEI
jgi:hypothetical protein